MQPSNRAMPMTPDDLSDAARRLLRSARIAPAGSILQADLALRTPALLRAVDNHWGALTSAPVDTEGMKKALTRLAIEILRRDDPTVPLDWVRSRLLRGVKAKKKLSAVVGGAMQLFSQRAQAMDDVKEGFEQADSLPLQLVQAAQGCGILKLVGVPGEPTNPRVRFSHDSLLYAFGALHDLTPRLLWTGVDDSGETWEGRRLYLAKLSLLDADDLAEGLDRVAEKNLEVATAFVLYDAAAMRREGEAVAEKYFRRVEWDTWRVDVEAARSRLEPFGDVAARPARAWTRQVLKEADSDYPGSAQVLGALPLGLKILGRHGRALDLDLLRRVERQAPRLGHQHLKSLRRELQRAEETLANRAETGQKAKRSVKKIGATLLVAGMGLVSGYTPPTSGGAALGAEERKEERELRQQVFELPDQIEALEEELQGFRQHVATVARQAIEAIEERTG